MIAAASAARDVPRPRLRRPRVPSSPRSEGPPAPRSPRPAAPPSARGRAS